MSLLGGLAAFAALMNTNGLPPGAKLYSHGANQPFCVEIEGASVCFAPGTSLEYVQKVLKRLPIPSQGQRQPSYYLQARWQYTMTNGFDVGGMGDPIALTYSFAPDGVAMPNAFGEPASPNNINAKFNAAFSGGAATWRAKLSAGISQWSNLGGLSYSEVSDIGTTVDPSQIGSGIADVRISGHSLDGPGRTLAYNFYPSSGEMVLDTDDAAFFANSAGDYLRLRNTAAHEHGHGLGFGHTLPRDNTKLMEAILSTAFDGPQDDDIRGVQRNYGDKFENNDTQAGAKNLGTLSALTTYDNLSTDSAGDEDWYRFTVAAGASLSVRTLPIGRTYLVGADDPFAQPPPPSPSQINTLQINKISFDVYASDGTTLLARRNTAAIGTEEVLSGLSLANSGGQIFIRVYNSGTVQDAVQRYKLEVNATQTLRVFSGTINLEGCVNKAQSITFEFKVGNITQFTRTVTLDSNGGFSLGNLPANNYTVGIKGAKWLRNNANVNVTASDYPGFSVTLKTGDYNNDNVIDVTDLLAIINNYNKQSGQNGFSNAADFNCDGRDDVTDLLLVIGNYNLRGDN